MTDVLTGVTIGSPAHGGHCVARVDGRVVFVRHTAPGEVVDVRLTEAGEGRKFWRGDAVAVHEASPDRVPSRWPEAGPGGVGGAELAHLTLPAQRRWKAEVVRDTLRRIGHVELEQPLEVHALGEDDARDGLATRTRIDLVVDDAGRAGMFRHRSHDVVALGEMPLAVPAITELDLFAPGRWQGVPAGTRLDVVAPSDGPAVVLADGRQLDLDHPGRAFRREERQARAGRPDRGRRPRGQEAPAQRVAVREQVSSAVGDLSYRVDATGFWQVHRDAPATLVAAVLDALRPEPGARVVDLYSGAGLFTLPLARAVGERGRVDAVEVNQRAVKDARRNLHADPQAVLHVSGVTATVIEGLGAKGSVDGIVLDPPRSGAGAPVMNALTELRPRRLVYVACDPAALARDLRTALDGGYELVALDAYDLFPHTHHVECVAVLEPR
ncbi:class I SAM-dependent RNA methyltransferase [Georgenia sp. 311]|uniref:Class I SAM-dependent RNA methyltransferase n=1 Tax=Georgenia wutianyii TaxID=2585135 RepID=A0ABX5VLS1_9MICO|nr:MULTISPECIES: TRAM domain-containing protein [Georgenia]QDB79427.1 class I SAM-dependent RNA methyltransferase [Georgenia wutianyii]TNC19521.1 class I SAM-dependent RNA methyltransferase [Georgenia sp. 311]